MKQCLIVDDNSTIRRIIGNMLTEFGFACEEAENGEAALAACARRRPDVIMLDWNMPVMSGIDFARALGQRLGGHLPAIIFCTTETDMSFIEKAMAVGASDYIMKPFERDMLRMKLVNLGLLEDEAACSP